LAPPGGDRVEQKLDDLLEHGGVDVVLDELAVPLADDQAGSAQDGEMS
jgi:hypothetical protein